MAPVDNRYVNLDLYLPAEAHQCASSLVSTSGAGPSAPFERQIDFWWTGLCIGLAMGQETPSETNAVKFITGAILSTDPWRITHLELMALGKRGADVLSTPKDVIDFASAFANTGSRWLAQTLLGDPEPTLTLSIALKELHDELSKARS